MGGAGDRVRAGVEVENVEVGGVECATLRFASGTDRYSSEALDMRYNY